MMFIVNTTTVGNVRQRLDLGRDLLVQLIASAQRVFHWVVVVRGVQVEDIHALGAQPLQGGVQLGAHALRFQGFTLPWVGFGGDSH